MEIMGNGIDISTGLPVTNAFDEQQFGELICGSLGRYFKRISDQSTRTQLASSFKGEIERQPTIDLGNPHQAGWTYLINPNQLGIQEFMKELYVLAEHRGMADPHAPLMFQHEDEEEWVKWLEVNYSTLDKGRVPYYILIVGGPDQVPFAFQALLNSIASVGRVDFDTPEELRRYIQKVIRLERAQKPLVDRSAVFFATDHGIMDPTYYSRLYMAQPLADFAEHSFGMKVTRLFEYLATKQELLAEGDGSHPALVFTASHGAVAPGQPTDMQKQSYGAIYCEPVSGPARPQGNVLAAKDIPPESPFLEGTVFFQFACFGYGNPAKSDFELWLGEPQMNAKVDFVSALPKRLLSNPRGPIAYIGHVDAAWLHGFVSDPNHPRIKERWHRRIEPFVSAVKTLLEVQPVGLAMGKMYKRFDLENSQMVNSYIEVMRGDKEVTPEYHQWLADKCISRSDAQNYMVFGDPAARLRIPSG
jgi:hypothetical protein